MRCAPHACTGKCAGDELLTRQLCTWQEALKLVRQMVKEARAVLVFCKDSAQLRRLHEHCQGQIAELKVLDTMDETLATIVRSEGRVHIGEGRQWSKKDMIIDKEAGEPGSVTLATAQYGRGEDFKYSPAVLEKGGGHAIQLYLSEIKADEIQVRGRIARKSEPGSYTLILNWSELKDKGLFSISGSPLEEMRSNLPSSITELYTAIDEMRNKMAAERFTSQIKKAERLLAGSVKTTKLLDKVREYFHPSEQSDSERLWAARKRVLEALLEYDIDDIGS